jgi:hypothetical protein
VQIPETLLRVGIPFCSAENFFSLRTGLRISESSFLESLVYKTLDSGATALGLKLPISRKECGEKTLGPDQKRVGQCDVASEHFRNAVAVRS